MTGVLTLERVMPRRFVLRLDGAPNRQFPTQEEAEDFVIENHIILSYGDSWHASRWTLMATSTRKPLER